MINNIESEFTRMIIDHKQTIYTVCYFFSDNKEDINDLYQEVLINLWRGYKNFRGDSNVKTWI